jgi:hypothetical protein
MEPTTKLTLAEHNKRVDAWARNMPTPVLRKVALALGRPANTETCEHEYPLQWLAKNSHRYHKNRDSVSRATIARWLPLLESCGVISITRRKCDTGRRLNRTSVYHICFDRVITDADIEQWEYDVWAEAAVESMLASEPKVQTGQTRKAASAHAAPAADGRPADDRGCEHRAGGSFYALCAECMRFDKVWTRWVNRDQVPTV